MNFCKEELKWDTKIVFPDDSFAEVFDNVFALNTHGHACFQKAILAMDSTVLDIDQIENLIKFCPTKEEMDTLKVLSPSLSFPTPSPQNIQTLPPVLESVLPTYIYHKSILCCKKHTRVAFDTIFIKRDVEAGITLNVKIYLLPSSKYCFLLDNGYKKEKKTI